MTHREPSSESSALKIYRRLLSYVVPYWKAFLFGGIATALLASTEAGFAALMKPLLDQTIIAQNPAWIVGIPFLLVGLFLFRAVTNFTSAYCIQWVARSVIRDLRGLMFDKLLWLPTAAYDQTSSGTLLSKMTYDVEQVSQASTNAITVMIRDTLMVIFLVALMTYYSWQLTLVFLAVGPIIAYLVLYVSRRFRKISRKIQSSMGSLTHITEEVVEGHRVVKTFGGHKNEARTFARANDKNRQQRMKLEATQALSIGVIQLIAAIGVALVVYIATLDTVRQSFTPGSFVALMTALVLLQKPVKRLTTVNSYIQRGIAAAESIFALLDQDAERDTGTVRLKRAQGSVEYDHVRFGYESEKGQILKDISFSIEPGQTVALVGRSGSGKSTVANLLPRFYDISTGSIQLDGYDIRTLKLEDLRSQIALVGQHATLFNETVRHNIAYGTLSGAEEPEIVRAADMAHAMEFIEKLPQQLDTLVGENGVLLSGGQRQRLAIARALLKNAPVLILDEATSALDTESERYIQAALEELMQNRTTLVIAHRLSTIERADLILVLDDGRIIESGTHATLLKRDGHYAALHRMQFREPERVA